MMICTCCQQDSAGNHTRDCPNNHNHSELSELTRLGADLLASQKREAKYKVAADKWLEQLAASQLECERLKVRIKELENAKAD